ncbi:MAG: helix-hairpin-helix domain-containing protein [Desulfurivibrionaceae bacterium]|nr:helix-hairpin-helix domain-containing protein [Desulfurivibrionaceae bacterium]
MQEQEEEITGQIRSIKYRNSEGWAVFKLDGGQDCTGVLAEMVDQGSDVTCLGVYVQKQGYPRQLKCSKVVPAPVKTDSAAGVAKILQRLPGIGPKKAMEAVSKHGAEQAWHLAKTDPAALGVAKDQAELAKSIACNLVESIEATIYLLGIGLTDNKCNRVLTHFGVKHAVAAVKENPYSLMDIDGFGFVTADDIAFKAGIDAGNPARVAACILYCLIDGQKNEGHVYQMGRILIAIVSETLTESAKKARVPLVHMPDYGTIRAAVYNLQAEGRVVIDEGRVYATELLDAEKEIEAALGAAEVF